MKEEFAVEHSGDGAQQSSSSAPLAHVETETYLMPPHGWTCFHCGETFANPNLAQAHFGPQPEHIPACVLIQERGMLYELREAQKDAAQARLDATRAEEREEVALQELSEYRRVVKVASSHEFRMKMDEMEGYVVTARVLIDAFFDSAPSLYEKVIGPRNEHYKSGAAMLAARSAEIQAQAATPEGTVRP